MVRKFRNRSNKSHRAGDGTGAEQQLFQVVQRRMQTVGKVSFPSIPVFAGAYTSQLCSSWAALGRPFSDGERAELRAMLEGALEKGYSVSPYTRVVVSYEAQGDAGLDYKIALRAQTEEENYVGWLDKRTGPLFGALPDAKVMACAAELGDPTLAPVLDVGAGTGRNAVALARRGHPTDAIERIGAFAEKIRDAAKGLGNLDVVTADIASQDLSLKRSHYLLAVMSEVLSHFSGVDELRSALSPVAEAIAPGGLLVVNAFLPIGGYVPDRAAREAAYTAISSIFTRDELAFIATDLPFELVSDESAYAFEKAHLPSEAFPPTAWYEQWSRGGNVFDTRLGPAPIELRWLVYRRRI